MNRVGYVIDFKFKECFTVAWKVFNEDGVAIRVFTSGLAHYGKAYFVGARFFIMMYWILSVTGVAIAKVPEIG